MTKQKCKLNWIKFFWLFKDIWNFHFFKILCEKLNHIIFSTMWDAAIFLIYLIISPKFDGQSQKNFTILESSHCH